MAKYKYILTVIITLCTLITYAQPAQYTPMTASGYQMKRLKVDSTLHLPSFCGVPTLRGSTAKDGALAIDTCGGYLYMWTNLFGWDTINVTTTGGGGNQDLQSVLNNGNSSYNKDINLLGRTSGNQIYISPLDNNWMPFMALGDSIGGGIYQYTYPQATIEFINKYMSQKLKGQDSIRATIYLPTQIMDATDTLAKLSDVRAVNFDSTSLSNRINSKLSISDTASMLSSYSTRINGKLNISDTASMLSSYSTRINGKLNIADTANKFVNRLTRTPGKDSIIYFIGGTRYAIKDSVGSNPAPVGYYGAWQDNVTQIAAADNTGYAMIFRTIDLANGVSVVTNGTNLTRITFANTGIYNLQFSSQFQNLANSPQDVTVWLRKNGTDVTGSSGVVGMEARKNPEDPYHTILGWNYLLDVVAGEYYELIWSTTDHTNVQMQFYAAGSPPPSAASVIMTVTQQSGIMAGTGITAINSLTGAAQTITTGTTGTDFAVSSTGNTHTFNLPTASATNRGALSSANWSTFNSKLGASDTVSLSNRINLKLNIADTASMLSSYSTRINGKLNIADTSTLQRKSIPAYTILANNTVATANVTAQQFRDTSGVYSGTITWTGTTAPSGATTHTYRLTQVGKCVTIHIALVYATNGAGLTAVQMTLPSGAPTPAQPTGLTGALANMYPINGQIANVANTIIAGQTRGFLRNNTAGNGYEIILNFQTSALGQVGVIAQYWTN